MRMRVIGVFTLTLLFTAGAAAQTTLATADSQVIIRGPASNFFAQPLGAGDLDGDGLDDLLVGCSSDFNAYHDRLFVFRGSGDFLNRGAIDLATASAELQILAAVEGDLTPSAIAVGDVNGDTFNDLVFAASGATASGRTAAGVVHILFGGADFFASPEIDLADTGSWDVRILGPETNADTGGGGPFGGFDAQALAVGNLNGDAFGDLAIGVHLASPYGSAGPYGRTYVIFGENFTSGTTLDLAAAGSTGYDMRIIGHGDGDELGEVVLTADLDGDTLDELILPNGMYSGIGLFSSEGRVHIWKGRTTGWPTNVSLSSTAADITISGTVNWDQLGATAAIGDFNGDGTDDLAVVAEGDEVGAAPDPNDEEGLVHLYLGGSRFTPATATYNIDAHPADLVVRGRSDGALGTNPIGAGDVNGDGRDDLILSQRDAALPGESSQGITEIILGRADFSATPLLSLDSGDSDYRVVGASSDQAGSWASAGDLDGDGHDAVLIGSSFNGGGEGTAWVIDLHRATTTAVVGYHLY